MVVVSKSESPPACTAHTYELSLIVVPHMWLCQKTNVLLPRLTHRLQMLGLRKRSRSVISRRSAVRENLEMRKGSKGDIPHL